jgi:hypothetical protein
MIKSEQAIMNRISAQMREACRGFIGDPICPTQIERMKTAVNSALCKFAPHGDFGDYINIKCDLEDEHTIIITPKRNAPLWVLEVFLKMNSATK